MHNTKPSTQYINGVKPSLGAIVHDYEIGRTNRSLYIWDACPKCGTERWVRKNVKGVLCKHCSLSVRWTGKTNPRWNSSKRTVTKSGIRVAITTDHRFACMAHKCGKGLAILEHRLVVAENLGRALLSEEVVHHVDGNNLNNKIENLHLLPGQTEHTAYTMLQNKVRAVELELINTNRRLALVEEENTRLKAKLVAGGIGNPVLNRWQ